MNSLGNKLFIITSVIRTTACLSILILSLSPSLSFALEPFNHEYKSTFAGMGAKSTRTLKEIGDGIWELQMSSKNFVAKYVETSRFTLDPQGRPVPIENTVSGRLFGISRKENTVFDWENGIATWTKKNDTRTTPISDGMVDRILYQLLIPVDLAAGAEVTSYEFINRGSQKTYNFERVGEETISISGQDIDTVMLRRLDDKQEKETTLWLAPDRGYELVRIHHLDEDGADYKMELIIK